MGNSSWPKEYHGYKCSVVEDSTRENKKSVELERGEKGGISEDKTEGVN